MMNTNYEIEYVENVNYEVVLDGTCKKEERSIMNENIKQLALKAGIKDFDNCIIEYEENEEGNIKFSVKREVIEKVPYKVEKSEISRINPYTITAIDNPEQEKNKILEIISGSGIDTSNADDFEIEFNNVKEDNTCEVIIYKKEKKKVSQQELEQLEEKQQLSPAEIEILKKEVESLKELKDLLENIENNDESERLINIVQRNMDSLDKNVSTASKMTPILEAELYRITTQIETIKERLEKENEKYNEAYNKIEQINSKEKNAAKAQKGKKKVKNKYSTIKNAETNKLEEINEKYRKQRQKLTNLTRRKNEIEKVLKQVEALDLTVEEYYKISEILSTQAIMNLIYKKKGLEDIIEKDSKNRTKEEKEKLKAVKSEVIEEIVKLQKEKRELSIVQTIEVLYSMNISYSTNKKVRVTDLSQEQINNIKSNTSSLPQKVIKNETTVDYVPGKAPIDMTLPKKNAINLNRRKMGKVVLYQDVKTFDYYAPEDVLKRFVLTKEPLKIKIDNDYYYSISMDDASFIIETSNNKYAPYHVEINRVNINEKDKISDKPTKVELEQIYLYRDQLYNKYYANKYVINRFTLSDDTETISKNGEVLYLIDSDDYDYIAHNGDNKYAPYEAKTEDIESTKEEKVETTTDNTPVITLYKDSDSSDIYVRNDITKRFNLVPASEGVLINGILSYKIDLEDAEYIIDNANNRYDPYIITTETVDVSRLNEKYEEEVSKEVAKESVEIETESLERIVIYTDSNNNKYVRKYPIQRFNLVPIGGVTQIGEDSYYQIQNEDAEYIIKNANNKYAPYEVDNRKFKTKTKQEENSNSQVANDSEATTKDIMEKIIFYRDTDNNNDAYVKKYVVQRFNLVPASEEVKIDTQVCYKIDNEDAAYIIGNANNRYAPYEVETIEVELGSKINPEKAITEDDEEEKKTVDEITIYRDLDTNDVYVKKHVVLRFNLLPISEEVKIDKAICYKIDSEDVEYIIGNANNKYSPYKIITKNVDLNVENDYIEANSQTTENQESVIEKITMYKDINSDNDIYVKDNVVARFHIENTKNKVVVNNENYYKISEEDIDFITGNANNNYSPYKVMVDNVAITNKIYENPKYVVDKITLYKDMDNGKVYVNNYVVDRFHLDISGKVKIDNKYYNIIDKDSAEYIIKNSSNGYSPYSIKEQTVKLENRESYDDSERTDYIVLYKDIETNRYYATEKIVDRFHLLTIEDGIDINGELHFHITRTDAKYIIENSNNKYSPYKITVKNIYIKDFQPKDTLANEQQESIEIAPVKGSAEENIDMKDTNDLQEAKEVSASEEVYPEDEDIEASEEEYQEDEDIETSEEEYQEDEDIETSKEEYQEDEDIETSEEEYQEDEKVEEDTEKHGRPHVEAIINKITSGLEIKKNDAKRYKASNLKVSKTFKEELSTGNVLYNIVHILPSAGKATLNLLNKLVAKLTTSARAKNVVLEIKDRLDDLSDEELQVLFEEYKGSQLKTDMNNQINELILEKLREYCMIRIESLNDIIASSYESLIELLNNIDKVNRVLEDESVDSASKEELEEKCLKLYDKAYEHVLKIISARKVADNILSSGLHGLEEDFKAVQTKLSYLGLKFSKDNDFNNELQEILASYGQGLNDAISEDDHVAAVENFINLEMAYANSTDVSSTIIGKVSKGDKYYSPTAQTLDYRNNSFENKKNFHQLLEENYERFNLKSLFDDPDAEDTKTSRR